MCGIAGIYHLEQKSIPSQRLKKMCDAMRHRGPDDEGYIFFNIQDEPFKDESYWVEYAANGPGQNGAALSDDFLTRDGDFNLALGHRRLAVIDLTYSGHQPMSNRANRIWITYNGEIYNFKELRLALQNQGHHFFSQSDTEAIIHLYEQYGVQAFPMLNGIFAFALWDGRKNELLLVRDRYGAKPLYYTVQNGILSFASEVKALLQVDGACAELNYNALCDYFTFQNTFNDSTLFKGVHLLEPGHYLLIRGEKIEKKQFWDFDFKESQDHGEKYYVENMNCLLKAVIRRQLISDVPIGSYLSGGLDSGTITAFASRFVPRLMTFTGGFDVATAVSIENFFDERAKAELMSREFGTEHYQMVIHAGDLEWALPRVIWHAEDLRVGMSYPHYYLARLASKFVKVVLAGAGGDEILGGYPWRYAFSQHCADNSDLERKTFEYWSRLINGDDKRDFFSAEALRHIKHHDPWDSFQKIMNNHVDNPALKRLLYFDAKTFLHGILVIEDKLSMAHSLESRVPFLDNELVDFASQIPCKYLLNDRWLPAAHNDINLSGKYILRRAMEGLLPKDIIENRKQGFSAPEQSWYMQQLVRYIKGIILSDRALDRGYFQQPYIEKILDEHISGKCNHRLLIWSLLSFEWWNRIFIDGEKVE